MMPLRFTHARTATVLLISFFASYLVSWYFYQPSSVQQWRTMQLYPPLLGDADEGDDDGLLLDLRDSFFLAMERIVVVLHPVLMIIFIIISCRSSKAIAATMLLFLYLGIWEFDRSWSFSPSRLREDIQKLSLLDLSDNFYDRDVDDGVPVIGILAQPDMRNASSGMQYIAASYPKWLEAAGARSVPIPYNVPSRFILEVLPALDGVLLPGGASALSTDVARLLRQLRHLNIEKNEFFPVWGTCLGFEFLVDFYCNDDDSDNQSCLGSGYAAENRSWPLEEVVPWQLYQPERIRQIAARQSITMNNHHQGVDPAVFRSHPQLSKLWKITSTNTDDTGRPFVSTIEPRNPEKFPVYGVQFHPEKNMFEYAREPEGGRWPYEAISHSPSAIEFGLYLAGFFVDLTRHRRRRKQDTVAASVKLPPDVFTYPIRTGLAFEQEYLIPLKD